jgi:hypothetical protein
VDGLQTITTQLHGIPVSLSLFFGKEQNALQIYKRKVESQWLDRKSTAAEKEDQRERMPHDMTKQMTEMWQCMIQNKRWIDSNGPER